MRIVSAATIALTLFSALALAADPRYVTLAVSNMTCAVCPITVKKSLQAVAGVSDVRVDFQSKTARVTFDPDKTGPADLTAATGNAGFPATVQ